MAGPSRVRNLRASRARRTRSGTGPPCGAIGERCPRTGGWRFTQGAGTPTPSATTHAAPANSRTSTRCCAGSSGSRGSLQPPGPLSSRSGSASARSRSGRDCATLSRIRGRLGGSRPRTGRASATTTGWLGWPSGCGSPRTSPGLPGMSSTPRTRARGTSRSPTSSSPASGSTCGPTGGPARRSAAGAKRTVPLRPAGLRRLLSLSLENKLSQPLYEKKRDKWLARLNKVVRAAGQERRSIVWVFEGWDAAGKGGAIRRLTDAIDARDFRVIPVAKPTDEEKSAPLPVAVLEARPEGRDGDHLRPFLVRPGPRRAARALRHRGRVAAGLPRAQRIRARAGRARRDRDQVLAAYQQGRAAAAGSATGRPPRTRGTRWAHEDWRNRRKWASYEIAVGDMLALTSTRHAPWHLVAANNKRHARLEIIKTSCRQIEAALGL